MTIAYLCIIFMLILTYGAALIAKWDKSYDNGNPRVWLDKQEGQKRRAYAAHQNGMETFPVFAAAVIIAHQMHAQQSIIDSLAIAFIISRIIYTACYIFDKPAMRSIVWIIGIACTIGIFFSGTY
jgi:uncharacterized MAPEG superfamily protein